MFVVGPVAIVLTLLWVLCGATLWDCVPIWHDEVWYYNEIAVFHSAGWDGGYTVSHEWTAKADSVHFGPHGPWFPALYGMMTRVAGLHIASIPVLNTALLILASLYWVFTCRPNRREAWVAALAMMTFWPLLLYLPSSMQEGLHMAIAVVLAAMGVSLIRKPESRLRLAVCLVAIVLAAQLRVTWAWMAAPVLWVAVRPRTIRAWALLAVVSLTLVAVLHFEAILLYSPYPNFMKKLTERLSESPISACIMLAGHTLKNLVRYVSPIKDSLVQVGMRYQLLLVAGAASIYLRRKKRIRTSEQCDRETPRTQHQDATVPYGFALLSIACAWAFVIVFYDVFDWRDYRVLAPHLLVAILVLAVCGAYEWVKGYVAVAVCLTVLAIPQFARFHRPRAEFDTARVETFARQVQTAIPFRGTDKAWDNTLLIDIDPLTSPVLAGLPNGIGVSVVNYWDQQAWPPRSKYVLLNHDLTHRLGVPESFRRVARTELGDIYITR